MRRYISIVIATLLLAVVGCTSSSTPESVATQYCKVMKSSDAQTLVSMIYLSGSQDNPQEHQEVMSNIQENFKGFFTALKNGTGGVSSFEVGEITESVSHYTTATVKITFEFVNETKEEQILHLIKIDDKWLINADAM